MYFAQWELLQALIEYQKLFTNSGYILQISFVLHDQVLVTTRAEVRSSAIRRQERSCQTRAQR
jgi:hypothetical protein